MNPLRQRTMSAMLWTVAQRGGQQALRFVVSVLLARILTPVEFGQVAMISVFLVISEKFVYAGFGSALIQKQDLCEEDCSTAFLFNIGVSLACYSILFAVAPYVADFYQQPLLTPLLRVTALKLPIDALCLVQTSLLARRMDFRTPTLITFVSVSLSGLLGLWLAFHGYGVWSLVWMSLFQRVVYCAGCWVYGGWRICTGFDRGAFAYCWNYGSRLLAGNLVDALFENLYDLIIGRVYSARDLGFFARGQSLQQLVTQNIIEPARSVLFSAYASMGAQRDRLRQAFHRSLGILALLLAPTMVGLGVLAARLVPLLYSDRWAPAVPLLQLFCPIGFLVAFKMLCINVFKATGRTDLVLKLQLASRALSLLSIILTFKISIQAMLLGECVASLLSWFIFAGRASVLLGGGAFTFLRYVWRPILLAALMGFAVAEANSYLTWSDLAALPLLAAAGAVLYLALAWRFRVGGIEDLAATFWRTVGGRAPGARPA
jgi:teichuronic acid exporter